MARWAAWMGIFTLAQVVVGVVGVIAVLKTLEQGRAALDTAQAANKLAAKQFEMGFKPWLVCRPDGRIHDWNDLRAFEPGEPETRTILYNWWLTIESVGDMPAVIVGIRRRQLDREEWRDEPGGEIYHPLTKGEKINVGTSIADPVAPFVGWPISVIVCKMTRENQNDLISAPPGMTVEIDYLDPLGKKRTLGVGFKPQSLSMGPLRSGGQLYNFDRDADRA